MKTSAVFRWMVSMSENNLVVDPNKNWIRQILKFYLILD